MTQTFEVEDEEPRKYLFFRVLTNQSYFNTKIWEMDHSKQTEISQYSPSKKHEYLKNEFILEILMFFWNISFD